MFITYITYGIYLLLIVIGAKFAGFKTFHEDFMSLNKTKALRGLCAIGVLLHHIAQQDVFQQRQCLSLFRDNGIYFVSIFFFCSGYGLIKSLILKTNYFDGFIKNRILKTLIIPYLISSIIYLIFFRFVIGIDYSPSQCILGALGLIMINDFAWFPIVLTIFYFVFYFAYKNNRSFLKGNLIVLAVIIILGGFFCINGHFAWWAGPDNWYLSESGWENSRWWMDLKILWFSGEWWVNTSITFLLGIIYGQKEVQINAWIKKSYWLKLLVAALLLCLSIIIRMYGENHFGYWTEFSGNGLGVFEKAVTLILQQPSVIMFPIFIFMCMMKINSENPITRFFGNLSLETYLMNYLAMLLSSWLIYSKNQEILIVKNGINLVFYELLVILGSVVLGLLYKKLCSLAKKSINLK